MDSLALGTPLVAVAGTLYAHRVSSSILAAAGAFAARQRDATTALFSYSAPNFGGAFVLTNDAS